MAEPPDGDTGVNTPPAPAAAAPRYPTTSSPARFGRERRRVPGADMTDDGIYTDTLYVLRHLSELVNLAVKERRSTLIEAADRAGVAYPTFHRVAVGGGVQMSTLIKIIEWLRDPYANSPYRYGDQP